MKLVAKTFAGIEPVLAKELEQLGASNIVIDNRAVTFEGDLEILYKANYSLRSALRILKPIYEFRARNPDHLYKHIYKIDWSKYLNTDQTFAIDSTVNSPYFSHSKYVALKTKDAIADQFRNNTGVRPSVDVDNPDLQLHIRVNMDEATLMLDSSGFSLHKRTYRSSSHQAPINEALAASLILVSGWRPDTTYIDLMCGSGTFLIEAAAIASNTAPGFLRNVNYAFERWEDYDSNLWKAVKAGEDAKIAVAENLIFGSDINERMIDQSKEHLQATGLDKMVKIKHVSILDSRPPSLVQTENEESKGTIILNPPYGQRLRPKDIVALYKSIGDAFKQNYKGYTAWVFSGNKDALKHLGLRTSKKLSFYNGSLECKFHRYDLY